jgi:hypothetical protein
MPMLEWDSMYFDREQKLTEIKRALRRRDYRVDPQLVADAIVRRLAVVAALKAPAGDFASARQAVGAGVRGASHEVLQNECSYPLSSSPASLNTTVAVPATTRPTSVAPLASALANAGPGTQAHSS